MEPLIDHLEVTVRDMSVAVPFYDRFLPLLGFDLKSRTSALMEKHEKHVVSYEHPRLGFAITSPRKAFAGEALNRRKPGALHHLAFKAASRAEVDRLHVQVRDLGATIVSPPREYPEYTPPGYYAFYFKDPDGIKYEIVCSGQGGPAAQTLGDVEVRSGYFPGAIGRVVELHAAYYRARWGFGAFFEAKVASELAEFFGRYDPRRDGFWSVPVSGRLEGSITVDGMHAGEQGAHLRWFIVSDALRGKGVGNRLIRAAVDFCRDRGHRRIYLWTFEGLDAARHLYEKAGFRLVEQRRGSRWGPEVTEQRFELPLESA